MNVKENIYVALLTAVAVVMGIFESWIPAFFAFAPGAKVGLANLVMIIAIFTLNWRKVWTMQVLRLLITALFTGFSVFIYSAAGAILSLLAMYLMKKLGPKRVSLIGISVVGGFFHNLGQLAVASLLAGASAVMLYLPWLAFFGMLAGFAIGIGGNQIIQRVAPIQLLFIKESKKWT
ncbi:Gx transporter family protein [Lactococcus garvieae]|jgi:heptaprenyl diphosphate synthase|uniref:Gx transporter family protein n=1 Tax=Lactococcus garvieae TaxID=1363 RepID=UPI0009BDC7A3|nr:Gx transporter family protein [Lactococcus garvieae]QPS71457.1 Gx transporter family protein [Lactococcus garvieae]